MGGVGASERLVRRRATRQRWRNYAQFSERRAPPTHLRFHADVHAGNLLALSDGRVAFIDFGIVGRIPPATAEGMLDFVRAFPLGDMGGVAAALTKMGFTKDMSDAEAERFARQLQEVLEAVEDVDPNQLANGVVDDSSLNRLVASVGEVADGNGIRFPREFALLVKQVLYFDRFTKILAPELDVMADERMVMNKPPETRRRRRRWRAWWNRGRRCHRRGGRCCERAW